MLEIGIGQFASPFKWGHLDSFRLVAASVWRQAAEEMLFYWDSHLWDNREWQLGLNLFMCYLHSRLMIFKAFHSHPPNWPLPHFPIFWHQLGSATSHPLIEGHLNLFKDKALISASDTNTRICTKEKQNYKFSQHPIPNYLLFAS